MADTIFSGREFYFGLKNNRKETINPILLGLGLDGRYRIVVELYEGESGSLIDRGDIYLDYSSFGPDDTDDWWKEYHASGREWLEKHFGKESYPASFEVTEIWKL